MMDKVRVHEIAKELGINSKEVVDKASAIGLNVKTASSSVSIEEAEVIMNYIMSGASYNADIETIIPKISDQIIPSNINLENIEKISISIRNLKSITSLDWSFFLKKGLYAIIAENGSGKSSLIVSLGKLVTPKILSVEFIGKGYENSIINYSLDHYDFIWHKNPQWSMKSYSLPSMPSIEGVIESSILSGSRFKRIPEKSQEREVSELLDTIEPVDNFISQNMNYILYGKNEGKFTNLKKITANQKVKKRRRKGDFPVYSFYALRQNNMYIKEYFFSTGEYFLLSLLKFIHEHHRNVRKYPALIIIDEIELSLHPLAQKRLIEKVKSFSDKYNLLFIFATHSLQIIDQLEPKNIHYLQNNNGYCNLINPIYPGYLSSKLYLHQSFDYVFLVEDSLAKQFVEKVIRKNIGEISMSYYILPIGGWEKLYEMYHLHFVNKIYGSAEILIVFDGDVAEITEANENKYSSYERKYLPFKNLESLVVSYLKENNNAFYTFINSYLMTKRFDDLDIDIFDGTSKKIKTTFKWFVTKMAFHCSINDNIMLDRIIEQILKQNIDDSVYKKFNNDICKFLELPPTAV